ncbi:hypothetical protein [Rhodoferax saidenbachensis]|uniref:hypothetical protein n=1 Tax=Rhodoferax saidenbachensis TaxID=1484693 RepID=UPI0038F63685
MSLLEVVANAGHAPSQTTLGYMYAKGMGVTADMRMSLYWLRKAAAAGDPVTIQILQRFEAKQ